MKRTAWTAAAGLALFAAPSLSAQESQDQAEQQAEAREIVVRIRKSMREMNKILLRGTGTEEAIEEGEQVVRDLEDLLDEAESKGNAVVAGLDELISLASSQPPPSGGGGSSSDQQESGKPKNQDAKREKSKDPQELVDQGEQPEQKPGGGEHEQDQPKDGEEPRSPRPDDSPPQQQNSANAPPSGATGEFQREDTAGRWGVLPAKEAEDLQRHAVEEFPQRYRHWMDLYYKRVNKSRR